MNIITITRACTDFQKRGWWRYNNDNIRLVYIPSGIILILRRERARNNTIIVLFFVHDARNDMRGVKRMCMYFFHGLR